MNNLFLKISSTLLAFVMLFSTFSFTVEKHFCGDFLVDVSFTGETEGCGMEMNKTIATQKKNCCKDEVHQIEGQDELQLQDIEKITFHTQCIVTAFAISYQFKFDVNEANTQFYKDFSPPDIPLDYQVAYQSFLI
ncbi:HYC_CC_PP family protein [Polaribacter sp.]|uniref:HYC_CC_PP family protein n=1 Tax=Polaribacter sp. TaxID=1920175 RepID=UPI003F6A6BE2